VPEYFSISFSKVAVLSKETKKRKQEDKTKESFSLVIGAKVVEYHQFDKIDVVASR